MLKPDWFPEAYSKAKHYGFDCAGFLYNIGQELSVLVGLGVVLLRLFIGSKLKCCSSFRDTDKEVQGPQSVSDPRISSRVLPRGSSSCHDSAQISGVPQLAQCFQLHLCLGSPSFWRCRLLTASLCCPQKLLFGFKFKPFGAAQRACLLRASPSVCPSDHTKLQLAPPRLLVPCTQSLGNIQLEVPPYPSWDASTTAAELVYPATRGL
jgi:hypothetical protein